VGWVIASEGAAGLLGFLALAHQARFLGPSSFGRVEYAAAVSAWLLVLVRGGFDVIVYREAARRPRLIGPLTDLLIGLRCAAAVVGFLVALGVAGLVGIDRGSVVGVAGLTLFASAWVADVGPRATGRLGWVAAAQAARAAALLAAVVGLVRGDGDTLRAAWCLVAAEAAGAAVVLAVHVHDYGLPRPRFRPRASLVLARRGAVAGLMRFARVTLYGLDLLALGWWAAGDVGPYAAARRVVFALVALGLVVPAMLGPELSRAWLAGPVEARRRLTVILGWLWGASLPAAVGLGLTADRWMPVLFGEAYRDGGPWLALAAARLPWLLAATLAQSALVAFRREPTGLKLVLGQLALGVVLTPAAAVAVGPWGVGWAALVVEATGAVAGMTLLFRLGAAPGWAEQAVPALAGCLGLIAGCRLTRGAPLPLICAAAALAYAVAWRAGGRLSAFRGGPGRPLP
jgi:O-antigen/teichoic acid export membrane protein